MSSDCADLISDQLGVIEADGADAFRSSARYLALWDLEGWDPRFDCPSSWSPEACFWETMTGNIDTSYLSPDPDYVGLQVSDTHHFEWGLIFRVGAEEEFLAPYFVMATLDEDAGLEAVEAAIHNCDPDLLSCGVWEQWLALYLDD